MKIGIISSVTGVRADIDQIVQSVVKIEKEGFDHYWFVHLPNIGYDAMQIAGVVGQHTSRIELGTAVVPTYPRHPFVMAQQALTTQVITGGRFTLGIGPSHNFVIEDMLGMEYDRPGKHTREYLTILQDLIQRGKSDFKGEFYRVDTKLLVIRAEPLSVMMAALGPVMLKVAGELTDGTITWMTGPKTMETHVVPKISAAAQAAGRPQPRVAMSLPVIVTNDKSAGRERVNELLVDYGNIQNYRRMLDIEGANLPGDVALVGNAAEVEAQLRRYADMGVTDYCALILPEEGGGGESIARTQAVLQDLIGKI